MNCSPLGSSFHGVSQARKLEWGATPFSRGCSRLRDRTWVSCNVGGLFTVWATRETLVYTWCSSKVGGVNEWRKGGRRKVGSHEGRKRKRKAQKEIRKGRKERGTREEGREEGWGKKEKRKDRSDRELQVRNMGKVEKSIMNVLIALVYRNEIRFFF